MAEMSVVFPTGGTPGPAAWKAPVAFAAGIACTNTAPATVVTYNGETYIVASGVSDFTSTGTFNPLQWTKIAAKGTDGSVGATGSATAASDLSFQRTTNGRLLYYNSLYNPNSGASVYGKAADFKLTYSSGLWTNGPPSEPNYVDDVISFGIGEGDVPGTRANANMPALAFRMESKYYQGPSQTVPASECHIEYVDINGVVHRPMTMFLMHDGGAGSSAVLGAGWVSLQNFSNVPQVDFKFEANQVNYRDGFTFNYGKPATGQPLAWQAYATGLLGALPYLDERGRTVLGVIGEVTTAPAAGSSNANGPVLRAQGATTMAAKVKSHGASADIVFECGLTQAASAPITVTCNGTTTIAFAPGAVTADDVGRAFTGANVVGSPVINDLNSLSNTMTVSVAQPATVTSITLSARTMRSATIGVDASGNLVLRQPSAGAMYFDMYANWIVRDLNAGSATYLRLDASGLLMRKPLGYGPQGYGVGGSVTQTTSKSTGVTLNNVCGKVTTTADALAAGAIVSFAMTNSTVGANDVVVANHVSGGTTGAYTVNARCAAGTVTFDIRNNTGGSLSEALVIQFALIKGATA